MTYTSVRPLGRVVSFNCSPMAMPQVCAPRAWRACWRRLYATVAVRSSAPRYCPSKNLGRCSWERGMADLPLSESLSEFVNDRLLFPQARLQLRHQATQGCYLLSLAQD